MGVTLRETYRTAKVGTKKPQRYEKRGGEATKRVPIHLPVKLRLASWSAGEKEGLLGNA